MVFRVFRNINMVDFKKDIRETCLSQSTGETAEELIDTYNMSIKIYCRQAYTWTVNRWRSLYCVHMRHGIMMWIIFMWIREAKREKRRCERKYKKINLESDRQNYIVKCKTIILMISLSSKIYLDRCILTSTTLIVQK